MTRREDHGEKHQKKEKIAERSEEEKEHEKKRKGRDLSAGERKTRNMQKESIPTIPEIHALLANGTREKRNNNRSCAKMMGTAKNSRRQSQHKKVKGGGKKKTMGGRQVYGVKDSIAFRVKRETESGRDRKDTDSVWKC